MKMLPLFPITNLSNYRDADSKPITQSLESVAIQTSQSKKFRSFGVSQNGVGMPFPKSGSSFPVAIRGIISEGSRKKMGWIKASWNVTNMKNVQSFRNFSHKYLVANAMNSSREITHRENSISVLIDSPKPKPVVIIDFPFCEKSFRQSRSLITSIPCTSQYLSVGFTEPPTFINPLTSLDPARTNQFSHSGNYTLPPLGDDGEVN